MDTLLLKSISLALLAQFVDTVLYKFGVWCYLRERAPKLIYKAVTCDFCRTWWVCIALSCIIYDLNSIIYIAIFSTIIKQLINRNINQL